MDSQDERWWFWLPRQLIPTRNILSGNHSYVHIHLLFPYRFCNAAIVRLTRPVKICQTKGLVEKFKPKV